VGDKCIIGKPLTGVEGIVEINDTGLINRPYLIQGEGEESHDVLSAFLKEFDGKKVRLFVEVI
jgi:hypothetical protein